MTPKPEAADRISKIELAAIKRDRKRLDTLKAEAEALAQSLHDREQDVIDRLEAGAPADGVAKVITRRRQSISWLTICKEELGEAAVIRAKDRWPVHFAKELQIG